MSLPPFLTRIHNAAGPLLGGIAESELGNRLSDTTLILEIDDELAKDPGHRAGYLLAANLSARFYPRLHLKAPTEVATEAQSLAQKINPGCDFGTSASRTLALSWCAGEPSAECVRLAISGWNFGLDGAIKRGGEAAPPAALAAAALGVGELFRALFADLLPHGRSEPSPFAHNLVTLGEVTEAPVPKQIDLGQVHLAGCGAIGQAAVATLAELPVRGTLYAVDHEKIDQGNLQRYVLAGADDVGVAKPTLVKRRLAKHALSVVPVRSRWGEDERSRPGQRTVLSAFDTKQARIELAGGLHREIFNAWTQLEDLGVSRHLAFGREPCLACLVWPQRPRPSEAEQIAMAFGDSELRVIRYLVSGTPVGQPLAPEHLEGSERLPLPKEAPRWTEHSLLEDLIQRYELDANQIGHLAAASVRSLYRDAVCAGMLLEHGGSPNEEIAVPLAHQSALAGIMLATWLVIERVPELRTLRPEAPQARYDVLRGGQQIWGLRREREPRCICSDPDFLAASEAGWGA